MSEHTKEKRFEILFDCLKYEILLCEEAKKYSDDISQNLYYEGQIMRFEKALKSCSNQ